MFEYEFNSTALTADLLNVDGDLELLGTVGLELLDEGPAAGPLDLGTKFTTISYSGEWNGGVFDGYANQSMFELGANLWQIRYDETAGGMNFGGGELLNFVTLTTVVPEPGTALLLLLGAAWTALPLRRRRR